MVERSGDTRQDVLHVCQTYKLTYSSDQITWLTYREPDSKDDKIFKGNTDPYKAVKVELDKPVYTRYVRLYPQTWKDAVALLNPILLCSLGLLNICHLQFYQGLCQYHVLFAT
ncbi:hypothetical protein OS493_023842 [Desmophyllum pertusum]|uniref:F5/8 type C domain-containing protein n=1 Tax=Desmophyllum pertusum TaxID=174260 RepID=A0A9X0CJ60_9CNID|nr:hypothetical protein OS493_023842 [Desmophyllum pertusum]